MLSRSVMSNSLQPHGLKSAKLLCPWGFPKQEYWSGEPFPSPGCSKSRVCHWLQNMIVIFARFTVPIGVCIHIMSMDLKGLA